MLILRDNGVVYLSYGVCSSLCSGCADDGWAFHEENAYFWRAPNDDDIIVSAVGCGFESSLFRYDKNLVSGELTEANLLFEVIPRLKKTLSRYGKLRKNGNMNCAFLFAQRERVYKVTTGYACEEVEEYDALGRGGFLALSAFRTSGHLPPEERLAFAETMIARGLGEPLCPQLVINTKTMKPYLLTPKTNPQG